MSERAKVRVRLGPFEVEATGQDQEELERSLRAGLLSAKNVAPILREVATGLELRPSGQTSFSPTSDSTATSGGEAEGGIANSLGEFLKNAHIGTETDRCITIATFLFRNGSREFTHREVLKAYDEAGFPHPTNIYDVLNRLVKKAHLRPSGEKDGAKSFAITRTGLGYAESLTSSDK